MTTDDLARILREHFPTRFFGPRCRCGAPIDPRDELASMAAHQAAVVRAAGWAKWPELEPKKTWYRSLTTKGKVWCETSDPDEVREMSKGKDCTFERYDIYEVTEGWRPWEA